MAFRRFPDAPARIAALPCDPRGFPVPWFVAWRDGVPHFPVIDAEKLTAAWTEERCWVCGDRLGAYRSWIVGPMSAIEGATPEPPSHAECATFSVTSCPHLASADARFSERHGEAEGYAAQPNLAKVRSAATALWVTKGRGATPFLAGAGVLFRLHEPARVEWYAHSRLATGTEVRSAIDQGLPLLRRTAQAERRSEALEARLKWLETWTPA
jgi:hypothetical protein